MAENVNEDLPEQTGTEAPNLGGAQTVLPGEDAADDSAAGAAPGGTAVDRGVSDAVTEGDSGGDTVADDADLPDETDGPVGDDRASAD
jgi:hypothetical protein